MLIRDKNLAIQYIKENGVDKVDKYIDGKIFHDIDFINCYIELGGLIRGFKSIIDNENLALKACFRNNRNLKYISDRLKSDFKFGINHLKQNPSNFLFLDEKLKKNVDFVTEVLLTESINVNIIWHYISDIIFTDKTKIKKICEKNVNVSSFISEELKKDKDFVSELIDINASVIYLFENFSNDKELVLKALNKKPEIYEFLEGGLVKDEDVFRLVINKNPSMFQYGPNRLINKREFALIGIAEEAEFITLLDEKLQNDISFILKALEHNNLVFEHLSEDMKCNKEVLYTVQPLLESNIIYEDHLKIYMEYKAQDDRETLLKEKFDKSNSLKTNFVKKKI